MATPIKLVIVDDHKIIRDGLKAIIKPEKEINVVGDLESGEHLMAFLESNAVDVILLDMHLPRKDGIEITKDVKALYPKVKILIHTMSELIEEIEVVVKLGVNGYILKTAGSDELISAIKLVAHGSSYFSNSVMNSFIRSALNSRVNPIRNLTPTELLILNLIYQEKDHDHIAVEMNITKGTLKNHLRNMYRKLNVKSEVGLIKYALVNRLVTYGSK
jgi:DNA-binding NarL/FixJ family response regulator